MNFSFVQNYVRTLWGWFSDTLKCASFLILLLISHCLLYCTLQERQLISVLNQNKPIYSLKYLARRVSWNQLPIKTANPCGSILSKTFIFLLIRPLRRWIIDGHYFFHGKMSVGKHSRDKMFRGKNPVGKCLRPCMQGTTAARHDRKNSGSTCLLHESSFRNYIRAVPWLCMRERWWTLL